MTEKIEAEKLMEELRKRKPLTTNICYCGELIKPLAHGYYYCPRCKLEFYYDEEECVYKIWEERLVEDGKEKEKEEEKE